jgi:hypothetical protein
MRHMPDGGTFADLDVVIDEGRLVDEIWRRRDSSDPRRRGFVFQGFLTALEHRQNPETFPSVGMGDLECPYTFQKVDAFLPQRLNRVENDIWP